MRIVQAVTWSVPRADAAVEQTLNTAAALARNGAEVTLLLPRKPGEPALGPDDFTPFLGAPANFAVEQWQHRLLGGHFMTVPAWLRRCQAAPSARAADVILSRAAFSMITGAGPGRRFVLDLFRTWPDNHPLLRGAIRRGMQRPDCLGLLAHSHHAADSFLRLGIDPGKVIVAHNGVDVARYRTELTREAARAALGLPQEGPLVVYAGRLVPWKGVDVLLDMARARPGLGFVLAGSQGAGPIEAAAAGLANVTVLPWLEPERLAVLLAAADVLVIPPSRRGLDTQRTVLPLKTFIYLAAGKPVLAPRLPDTEGLLVDGENALLVEPDALDAALAALDRLLADGALARRLGAAAQQLALGKSWDARAQAILAFLERRLAQAGRQQEISR